MKSHQIEITETLQTVVTIKANELNQALEVVNQMYKNEEIVLNENEHVETLIEPYLYSDNYLSTIENPDFKVFMIAKAIEKVNQKLYTEELVKFVFGDIQKAMNSFENYKSKSTK